MLDLFWVPIHCHLFAFYGGNRIAWSEKTVIWLVLRTRVGSHMIYIGNTVRVNAHACAVALTPIRF